MKSYRPKSITIFLVQGNPTGIKSLELSGWNGKGYLIPRSELSDIVAREDLNAPSVYFLVGELDNGKQKVYVGESENFVERVQYHNRNKDFWNLAICFISKDETLNKAYVKYLESLLLKKLQKAARVEIEVGKDSRPARLSEFEIASADEFADNLEMILSTVGYTFLKEPLEEVSESDEVWFIRAKGVEARGMMTSEGFTVLRDSEIVAENAPSIPVSILEKRQNFFSSDVSAKVETGYKAKIDLTFGSPSTAAAFVLGNSVNGWTAWKDQDGKTLEDKKRN